jgi:N-terminal domain of (some) glycogen debranching enzymes
VGRWGHTRSEGEQRLRQPVRPLVRPVTEPVNLAEATVVKAGNGFCVALRDGRLPIESDHPLGLYLDDCRHLRGHELRLGGRAPRPLVASDSPGTAAAFS